MTSVSNNALLWRLHFQRNYVSQVEIRFIGASGKTLMELNATSGWYGGLVNHPVGKITLPPASRSRRIATCAGAACAQFVLKFVSFLPTIRFFYPIRATEKPSSCAALGAAFLRARLHYAWIYGGCMAGLFHGQLLVYRWWTSKRSVLALCVLPPVVGSYAGIAIEDQ